MIFLVKMSCICPRMKHHFYIKGSAFNLVLIQRPGGTRKWANWRSGKEKRKSLSCVHVLHVVVVQWRHRSVQKSVMHSQNCCFANLILLLCHAVTAMKCTKERDAPAELLFCQSNPIAFLPFLLTSPSSTQCVDWSFHDTLTHQ